MSEETKQPTQEEEAVIPSDRRNAFRTNGGSVRIDKSYRTERDLFYPFSR